MSNYEELYRDEIIVIEDDIEFFEGYEPDWETDGGWGDTGYPDLHLGDKRSEITGNLKEMVLKRVGIDTSFGVLDHKVEIIESHENGGYCGTCAFEYLVFTILVDGEQVYSESYNENPFGVLRDWLTDED